MSIVSDMMLIRDLVNSGSKWLRKKQNPVRIQSNRLLESFEAHGIARQQVVRVMPRELDIPPAAFSNADRLEEHLTPALLDWTADYLALDRSWLDGLGDSPHQHIDGYKNEAIYSDWFRQRIGLEPTAYRLLRVWTSYNLNAEANPSGDLCVVYSEGSIGLDGNELRRYWLLSNQWPVDHRPCVDSMLKIVKIARSYGISTVGRIVDHQKLQKLGGGHLFASQVNAQVQSMWYPEDMIAVMDAA